MTGKEMIKIIQDNGLEDFVLRISHQSKDSLWGFSLENYYIDTMVDIGHSDVTVTFDIIKK